MTLITTLILCSAIAVLGVYLLQLPTLVEIVTLGIAVLLTLVMLIAAIKRDFK